MRINFKIKIVAKKLQTIGIADSLYTKIGYRTTRDFYRVLYLFPKWCEGKLFVYVNCIKI